MSGEPGLPASSVLPCQRCPAGATSGFSWDLLPRYEMVDVVTGEAPRQATSFRICWDDVYLRVLFEVEDDEIHAPHRKRDDPVYEADAVELFLDPWASAGRVYLELDTSPAAVVFDALILNRTSKGAPERDITTLPGWHCSGLVVRVKHADGTQYGDGIAEQRAAGMAGEMPPRPKPGWAAELALPLASLSPSGRRATAGERWGWNAYRVDRSRRGDEYQAWRPTGRLDFHRPEAFGEILFES